MYIQCTKTIFYSRVLYLRLLDKVEKIDKTVHCNMAIAQQIKNINFGLSITNTLCGAKTLTQLLHPRSPTFRVTQITMFYPKPEHL